MMGQSKIVCIAVTKYTQYVIWCCLENKTGFRTIRIDYI